MADDRWLVVRAPRVVLLATILGPLGAVVSCASLSGLSGGEEGGHDAAPDAGRMRKDAGHAEAGRADATTDARDAGPERDAASDAFAHEASKAEGAPEEAGCTAIEAPDAGLADACAPDDALMCAPLPLTATPTFTPPVYLSNLCAPSQLDALYAACIGADATPDACDAYQAAPITANCYNCIFGGNAYGPYLLTGAEGYVPNVAGCLALSEPCQIGCATMFGLSLACETASCSQCGALDNSDCTSAADMCACAEYTAAVNACSSQLSSDPVALKCLAIDGDPAVVLKSYGLLFCGPAVDGGA